MGFFKSAACWLGLVDQGWVKVRGPGVDVVITGDRERVQRVLGVVQRELIRVVRESSTHVDGRRPGDSSPVVPTEFDDRDSPYVVSGRVVRPRPRPRLRSKSKRALRSTGRSPDAGVIRSFKTPAKAVTADAETEQVHYGILVEITEQ